MKKPFFIHSCVTNHMKKRITIVVKGGTIQDVVRENDDTQIIINDYDIEGENVELGRHFKKDENGEVYRIIQLV